jgi:flagellar basal-body rod protein FlgF
VDYGLNIAASGALTAMYRQDVFANNLANMDTAGFKPDIPLTRQRPAARVEDHLNLPSNAMLERLGAGVLLAPNRANMAQGAVRVTSNPWDVAVQGEGFFVVAGPGSNTSGTPDSHLTRDGRFMRNSSGTLVNQNGYAVLDVNNRPINVPGSGEIRIDGNGMIRADGREVAQLRIASLPAGQTLRKEGDGLFPIDANTRSSLAPASGSIRQYSIEDSGVDEIRTLMQISSASREADANFSMISQLDRINGRMVNTFGRVS